MSRRRRRGSGRRWIRRLMFLATLAALGGGMLTAVERGSEGRALSREIEALERREATERARVVEALRRVDSLSSRDRITRVAAEQGLRPASDEEISLVRLPAVTAERREP